ncbi:MAG: RNB domain-containing ribonuclease, partial [Planctomycetota bacterium]
MPRRTSRNMATDTLEALTAWLAAHPDRPLKLRALARELDIADRDYTSFRATVRQALQNGVLVLGAGRTLRLPARQELIGVFRANRRGFGFVELPEGQAYFVSRARLGGARDGDTVGIRRLRQRGGEPNREAEVVRIIERAPLRWVGVLEQHRYGWTVQPQGRNPLPLVTIENPGAEGSQVGDLVVVEPREESLFTRVVRGRIVERLGDPADARARVIGVIRRNGLREQFPPRVLHAAQHAAARFDPAELSGRADLRDLLTVTIDPPDAQDFDDAISVEQLPGGRTRLGVHIADVAHFVPAGGPVDLEARERGNSAYFPGHVVPMLPPILSNDACSLRPGETRLTKSVFITYDEAAQVLETRFAASAIRSAARLNYVEVSAALAGRPTDIPAGVMPLLRQAEELARRIRRRRLRSGMLVLTIPEVEVRLDANGRVVDAGVAERSFPHTIIEMFMVEANEAASRALREAGFEHLRRIHPPPEPEQAEALAQLAPLLGHRPPNVLTRETINRLLDDVRGRPEEPAVNMVLLRSLAQAAYSPANIGHFALASADYCHFTSPIRRYPDLAVHRLLELALPGSQDGRGADRGHPARRRP